MDYYSFNQTGCYVVRAGVKPVRYVSLVRQVRLQNVVGVGFDAMKCDVMYIIIRTATCSCRTRERAIISVSPIYYDNVDMLTHH